ncbi:B12-binding domain-containing protein [Sulfitobacter sp. S190]|uniref:cobalamin B12-binding domain-containing protein n=1 Tax=Sulfitobacter sp. S190 TaxID=2867022 RepID=UPI0021A414C5|nr:cobalamin B12-binding domain-containing protein [Sulfitobacter sp. S190]UWR24392.1 cobalamin B12-binding domain-containing protein [Sulfitobacter sp. S190]
MRPIAKSRAVPEDGDLDGVARQALNILARGRPRASGPIDRRLFDQLMDVVIDPNDVRMEAVRAIMRARGVNDAAIADHYIPALARELGALWSADQLSFQNVSLGSIHLTALLRQLDPSWCSPQRKTPQLGGTICIIVPQGVQHTLGASILAGQLRRAGEVVRLGFDLPLQDIPAFVGPPDTSAALISASSFEGLDFLGTVVRRIKQGNAWLPILIGGNALDRDEDLCELTGADFATTDWKTALSLCSQRLVR